MQETWVQSLIQEDPTWQGAAKPMSHSYWTCALKPRNHNYWDHVLQLLKPVHLERVLCNNRSHRNERPGTTREEPPLTAAREKSSQKWRPGTAKINWRNYIYKKYWYYKLLLDIISPFWDICFVDIFPLVWGDIGRKTSNLGVFFHGSQIF